VSVPIPPLTSWQRPVFLINSRLDPFTATPLGSSREGTHLLGAPLLPKLRGQFAEFLSHGSLARLRIFTPPTCVGLRYGLPETSRARFFLAVCSRPVCGLTPSPSPLRVMRVRICLHPPPTGLDHLSRQVAGPSLLRHPSRSSGFRQARDY
jgi:hypothetical protein